MKQRQPLDRFAIAMVSEHASPLATLGGVDAGGQNVHVAALAGALADRGHRVTVYTRRDDAGLPAEVELRPGVTVHHVPAGPSRPLPKDELLPHMGAFGRYLATRWADEAPAVVHSHFWMSGLAALLGAGRAGLPVVHTYHALGTVKRRHQGAADTSPPERIAAEYAVGRDCRRIVATCRDEVRELGSMGLPGSRTRVVPCGVDVRRFTPHGRTARGSGRPRLLQVGRLVPRKGADTAIRALAGIPGAELVIAGGPPAERLHTDPEARRLAAVAARAGVADRCVMLGAVPREDMPALLRSADIVLCPSVYEPFGIMPLEAMACAVPVIASAVGGHLDSIADRTTGRLFPPGDVEALVGLAARLLASPDTRAAYGAAGRRRALARYGWDRVAAATEQVYREVVEPAPGRPLVGGVGGQRVSGGRPPRPGGPPRAQRPRKAQEEEPGEAPGRAGERRRARRSARRRSRTRQRKSPTKPDPVRGGSAR